ncbi:anthrone oxygenase family protein [Nocardioides sp. WS12]|uniref:anthrone oxygenase family protein n=1 Tax=Nocardioides sp. WS12 TaxID=2486272 RepID=UPI0015FE64E7|nr:anthrone oxygenase family protein [Nocardioides sp. WS12]
MNEVIGDAALVTGTIGAGLVAGLFFAFSTAIMPGLAQTDDRTFVDAMQQVNVAILNPLFLLVFVVPIPALGIATFTGPSRPWVVAALVLYVVMFAITMAGNVPLNDALLAVGQPDGEAALRSAREAFEAPWNRLHLVRTVSVVAAFGCCVGAAMTG